MHLHILYINPISIYRLLITPLPMYRVQLKTFRLQRYRVLVLICTISVIQYTWGVQQDYWNIKKQFITI